MESFPQEEKRSWQTCAAAGWTSHHELLRGWHPYSGHTGGNWWGAPWFEPQRLAFKCFIPVLQLKESHYGKEIYLFKKIFTPGAGTVVQLVKLPLGPPTFHGALGLEPAPI